MIPMRMLTAGLIGIALAIPLTCAATNAAKSIPAGQLTKPDALSPTILQDDAYLIGPFDTLDITVFQVDLLTKELQVDGAGHIQFPMIGEVTALGKTAKQLSDEIAADLDKSYLRSPQVTVYVKDSASQKFTVEGGVKTSGIYPLQGHMTLLRAIATAQGIDPDAKPSEVVIFRMVNHQRMAGVVNLGAVGKGKIDDPQIYAGDVIVVPMSASRKLIHDLVGVTPLLFLMRP